MKVLHIHPCFAYGGIESLLSTLGQSRGFAPELQFEFGFCLTSRLVGELENLGYKVSLLGTAKARYPWQILSLRKRLRMLLQSGGFDVVICHSIWMMAVGAKVVRACGLPLVYWMHNNVPEGRHNLIERMASGVSPDLVICNSQFTADSLGRQFKKLPPSEVIHCPVSPAPFQKLERSRREDLRSELGAPPETCVIIQVCRPEPWKGQRDLLEAAALLPREGKWQVWMVGGASTPVQEHWLSDLVKLAGERGMSERIKFLGSRIDVPELLAAADVFCQPNSTPEPFGLVFAEALFCGLPVVSYRHGGVVEIVDETCAVLVPAGDRQSLSGALLSLIENPALRETMAPAARARGEKVCHPRHILPQVARALQRAGQTNS